MLSDEKRAALIQMCHDAGVMVLLDSKFGRSEYTSVQSSWPALEKLATAVAEAAVKAERENRNRPMALREFAELVQKLVIIGPLTSEQGRQLMMLQEMASTTLEAAVKDAVGGDAVAILNCGEIGPTGEQDEFEIDCEYGALERFTSQHPGKKFKLYTRPQASAAVPEDAIDAVSKAMTKAWQLGQDYWRQADGDTQAEWDESGHTEVRFQTLLDETTSMLAASQPEVRNVE